MAQISQKDKNLLNGILNQIKSEYPDFFDSGDLLPQYRIPSPIQRSHADLLETREVCTVEQGDPEALNPEFLYV